MLDNLKMIIYSEGWCVWSWWPDETRATYLFVISRVSFHGVDGHFLNNPNEFCQHKRRFLIPEEMFLVYQFEYFKITQLTMWNTLFKTHYSAKNKLMLVDTFLRQSEYVANLILYNFSAPQIGDNSMRIYELLRWHLHW